MFSHLVTAAKGILTRQDAEEARPTRPSTPTTHKNPKMVTATRRGNIPMKATESETNGMPVKNGVLESMAISTGKKKGQNNKRRRSSVEDSEEDAQDEPTNGDWGLNEESKSKEEKPGPPEKSNHIRFGSEEPAVPEEIQAESVLETEQENQDDEESSNDDDVPETIDNSAQLSKIKLEAQKREQARQRSVTH